MLPLIYMFYECMHKLCHRAFSLGGGGGGGNEGYFGLSKSEERHLLILFCTDALNCSKRSPLWCTFQILGCCQGRRTGVGVTTVSNSLILGGWVTKVLIIATKNMGVEGWVTTIF